jgi:succinyl-CoA synthetase beta subunit
MFKNCFSTPSLEQGGGANKEQVNKAFGILNEDPQVKAILVNIFGGIMRCDVIALGMIQAAQELGIKKPIIIRMSLAQHHKASHSTGTASHGTKTTPGSIEIASG